MKVEMLRLMCSPTYGNRQPGDVVDMDEAEALKRIENGDCRALEESSGRGRRGRASKSSAPAGVPDEKPIEKMTAEELKTYAAAQEIDLGDATKKDDVRAKIVAELEARRDEDENGGD